MSSKQTTRQSQDFNKQYQEDVTGIDPYKQAFDTQYGSLASLFKNRANTPLNLQTAPTGFSTTFDPLVAQAMSQGKQTIGQQESANQARLAQNLGVMGTGSNQALLNVLQRQGQIGSAGAMNALIPQGLQAQREFDIAKANMIAQANQQALAARAQQMQEIQQGTGLLDALVNMARTAAGKKASESGASSGYSRTTKGFF